MTLNVTPEMVDYVHGAVPLDDMVPALQGGETIRLIGAVTAVVREIAMQHGVAVEADDVARLAAVANYVTHGDALDVDSAVSQARRVIPRLAAAIAARAPVETDHHAAMRDMNPAQRISYARKHLTPTPRGPRVGPR